MRVRKGLVILWGIVFGISYLHGMQSRLVAQEVPIDVYLIVDLSGSFADDLPAFKNQAPSLINAFLSTFPNVRIGLGSFRDYPIGSFGDPGDWAYRRMVDLTSNVTLVLNTISNLQADGGDDDPESQLAALYQAATGIGQDTNGDGDYNDDVDILPGQQASFRLSAIKIILLWTDASFHTPADSGYPGPDFQTVINALNAAGIWFVGIAKCPDSVIDDLRRVAEGTGTLAPFDIDCNDDGYIDIYQGEPLVCEAGPEEIGEVIFSLTTAVSALGPKPSHGPVYGRVADDFETCDFSRLDWRTFGDADWFITRDDSHSGNCSARAGVIGDNGETYLELACETSEGIISFWYKVSSESGYDGLCFYIDYEIVDCWTGEIDWTQASYPVSAGFHTFTWEYTKDGSVSEGADTAWIDDIALPGR